VPKENIEIDETTRAKNQKLFETLDDHDDVQNIYSNFNL